MKDFNEELNLRIEDDHKKLLKTLEGLEEAFCAIPEPAEFISWKLDKLWRLRDFHNLLHKHFDLEEQGGYNEKLTRQAPQLIPKIEHLEEEHRKIASDLNHIIEVIKGIDHVNFARIDRAKCRVENLIRFIRRHEATETAVIQEAYYQDYGIGD